MTTELDMTLIVTDVIAAPGRGTRLLPKFTAVGTSRGPFDATLTLPSGEVRAVQVSIEVAHQRGPLPPFAMARLDGLAPEEVPVGSEVRWRWSARGM